MKLKTLFFSLTALTVFGCSEIEQPGQDYISFKMVLRDSQTKAGLTGVSLGTYAWRTSSDWASTADSLKLAIPFIVNAETNNTDPSYDGEWRPGRYRWPSQDFLHFILYGPYNVSSPVSFNLTDGLIIENYTVSGYDDLIYSDLNTDYMVNVGSLVPITLNHALSRVSVNLVTDSAPSNIDPDVASYQVTVTDISLDSLKNTGTFKSTIGGNCSWNSLSGKVNRTLFSGSKVLSETEDNIAEFYVLPQVFEDSLQAINLTYTVDVTYTDNTTTTATFTDETYYLYDLPDQKEWETGYNSNYLIIVSAFTDSLTLKVSR